MTEPTTKNPPTLPNTSDWVQREPGESIAAGTPLAFLSANSTKIEAHFSGLTHEVTVRDGAPLWTPPATPSWEAIPEGRENAKVLRVNGVVGTYFRDGPDLVAIADPRNLAAPWWVTTDDITSVEPVDLLPADHVAVPRHPSTEFVESLIAEVPTSTLASRAGAIRAVLFALLDAEKGADQ